MSARERFNKLLTKASDYDKDERYMATSDIIKELEKMPNSGLTQSSVVDSMEIDSYNRSNHVSPSKGIDSGMLQKICKAVLKQLDDKNTEVQSIAVKALGVLVTKVSGDNLNTITDKLLAMLLTPASDSSGTERNGLKDLYGIGLKKLINDVPNSYGGTVCQRLVSRLISGAEMSVKGDYEDKDKEVGPYCFTLLTTLLSRFATNPYVVPSAPHIVRVAFLALNCDNVSLAKLGGGLLSMGGRGFEDEILFGSQATQEAPKSPRRSKARRSKREKASALPTVAGVIPQILSLIDNNASNRVVLCQALGSIISTVGHRCGKVVDTVVPMLLNILSDTLPAEDDEDDDSMDQNDDEEEQKETNNLRTAILQTLSDYVGACPTQMLPHHGAMAEVAVEWLKFDPNYTYDDDSEDDDEEGKQGSDDDDDDDDDDDEDVDEDDYSDDGDYEDEDVDNSWTVRRAACRNLQSIVKSSNSISWLWMKSPEGNKSLADFLLSRFKERDDSVRVDVVLTFNKLLKTTVAELAERNQVALHLISDDDVARPQDASSLSLLQSSTDPNSSVDLISKVPKIVFTSHKIISELNKNKKKSSEKSKSAVWELLSITCMIPGVGLGDIKNHGKVFAEVKVALTSESVTKSEKLDILKFLSAAFARGESVALHLKSVLPLVQACCKDSWYKISSEGIVVMGKVCAIFSSYSNGSSEEDTMEDEKNSNCGDLLNEEDMKSVVTIVYESLEPALAKHDQDQEIKEAAIDAVGKLLVMDRGHLHDDQRNNCLELLYQRLSTDTTRMAALRALSYVASNCDPCTMGAILAKSIEDCSVFLRQNNRSLIHRSLETLSVLLSNNKGAALTDELYSFILAETSVLIDEGDQTTSNLAVTVSNGVLCAAAYGGDGESPKKKKQKKDDSVADCLNKNTLPKILAVAKGSKIFDASMCASVENFLASAIRLNVVDFDDVLQGFGRVDKSDSKASVGNLAKCTSACIRSTNETNRERTLSNLINSISSSDIDSEAKNLAILSIGELGSRISLANGDLATMLLQQFSAGEDVEASAAYSLGSLAVGNTVLYLPSILKHLDPSSKEHHKQHLLLTSLREMITKHVDYNLVFEATEAQNVLTLLASFASSERDGVRLLVSECLGGLLSCTSNGDVYDCMAALAKKNAGKGNEEFKYKDSGDAWREDDDQSRICCTMLNSLRFYVSSKGLKVKSAMGMMVDFVMLLQDDNLSVLEMALKLVAAALHHHPKLCDGLWDSILPMVYECSKRKIVREIDLGPFKHKIDDALVLRKETTKIFSTMLDQCPKQLNLATFFDILHFMLSDDEDVKLGAHAIVINLCRTNPTEISGSAEALVDPLVKVIYSKVKDSLTATEKEKIWDNIRSAMRAFISLYNIDACKGSKKIKDTVAAIQANEKMNREWRALCASNA